MRKSRFTIEERTIILDEYELLKDMEGVCLRYKISKSTLYNWRQERLLDEAKISIWTNRSAKKFATILSQNKKLKYQIEILQDIIGKKF